MRRLALVLRGDEYSVVRFPPHAPLPPHLLDAAGVVSVTRTERELSVVCPSAQAPEAERAERGWRLLSVAGPLEFSLTGVTAALSGALAAAGVPMFALSTFDTDHLLVKQRDLDRATEALVEAGHEVHQPQ